MESLQKSLEEVLPDLGQDLLIVVVEHLKNEIGVNSPEDFKYIQESDLPMLKPIQRRRLLDILKKETSDCKTADTTKQDTRITCNNL
ncbi:hypothetical protein Pmani_032719 [Petrolisthes manimaculis]|uniref:Uncharacterized protein n=1 Tax=Petrolisthes manimaculis TaxID=1843537 RepID=A0AAE1TTI3_9EUCA|nr:hypothetical protein Pmani_032719 [Petrolisthes manimaculis]